MEAPNFSQFVDALLRARSFASQFQLSSIEAVSLMQQIDEALKEAESNAFGVLMECATVGHKWREDSSLAAWFPISFEHLKQAFETYEEAFNEGCECYSNPDGGCGHCERIEKARRLATGVIGEYTQG